MAKRTTARRLTVSIERSSLAGLPSTRVKAVQAKLASLMAQELEKLVEQEMRDFALTNLAREVVQTIKDSETTLDLASHYFTVAFDKQGNHVHTGYGPYDPRKPTVEVEPDSDKPTKKGKTNTVRVLVDVPDVNGLSLLDRVLTTRELCEALGWTVGKYGPAVTLRGHGWCHRGNTKDKDKIKYEVVEV